MKRFFLRFCLSFFFSGLMLVGGATAQVITTVAGTGTAGYTGDGADATSATLNYPKGVCADLTGNVYMADSANNCIRMIDLFGTITTIAGDGTAGYIGDGGLAISARLSGPTDVKVDFFGNIYIADRGNHAIRVINSVGIISTLAGDGTPGFAGDGGSGILARLNEPSAIAVDVIGNVYVADVANHRIRIIDFFGDIDTYAGTGTAGYTGDGSLATLADIQVNSVAVDGAGIVYMTDGWNNRIRMIDGLGVITTIAGIGTAGSAGDGGPATSAELNRPYGITVSGSGDVFFSEKSGHRVRRIDVDGYIWTSVATGTAGYSGDGGAALAAQVNAPAGVFIDIADNLFIADEVNHAIRHVNCVAVPTIVPLIGENTVCTADTSQFSTPTLGGIWSTSDAAVATVDMASGIVFGVAVGSATISYSVTNICGTTNALRTVTIITTPATPAPISGSTSVCVSGSISLSDATAGGTWSSSDPFVATVSTSTGTVYGGVVGTTTISYTVSNICGSSSAILTVSVTTGSGIPPISGDTAVCIGSTITLTNATAGGEWSSVGATATVGSTTGIVTGVSAGTVTVSYTVLGSCGLSSVGVEIDVEGPVLLGAISGTSTVCEAATTTLSNAMSGGVWTSGDLAIATVDATGIVTGVSGGTATITYAVTNSCGTADVTETVTVSGLPAAPAAITGLTEVCEGGGTITLSSATGGGAWSSSNTSIATVDAGGVVYGVTAGTITISYSVTNSCGSSHALYAVTVNPVAGVLPAISGITNICSTGGTSTLSNAISGGAWVSSDLSVATIGTAGDVYAVAPGTAIISYTVAYGCGSATTTVTLNSESALTLSAISGALSTCASGGTTSLSHAVAGGVWSSSDGSVATVDVAGNVTGVIVGTADISYSVTNSCGTYHAIATVTVNGVPATPSAISGPTSLCSGTSISLSSLTSGGTWLSTNTAIATVDAAGNVSGVIAGIIAIRYTVSNSCGTATTSVVVTVNLGAAPITGATTVCIASTSTLSNTGSGTWTSSTPSVATIGLATGVVTGVATGTTIVTYTEGGGCTRVVTVTVIALPAPITGTPTLCAGTTTSLSNSGGGNWSSSNLSVATVGLSTGVVLGSSAGTATITYTLGTGCTSLMTVTVFAQPGLITGPASVCVGATISLSSGGGGTWVSSSLPVATVGSSNGVVSGVAVGTTTITYTLLSGCSRTRSITVNPLPGAITGTLNVCVGSVTSLSNAGGGTWASSTLPVATVVSASGVVRGVSAGTTTITYALSTGCRANAVVTVNPLPTAILGTNIVCSGSTTSLSSASAGGTWLSGSTSVATVSSAGDVTGVGTGGVTNITYTLPTSCAITRAVTVNPVPAPIMGGTTVCVGLTSTLSSSGGGTWMSGSSFIATVGVASGIVRGVAIGTSDITYTLPTGCIATTIFTVNSVPSAITGTTTFCTGTTVTLSSTGSGTWSSSTTTVATAGLSTGVVGGVSAGTSAITYSLGSGCNTTAVVTVLPLPSAGAILGVATVCLGGTATLSGSVGGGTWNTTTGDASISSSGVVSGMAVGIDLISYTVTSSCGTARTTRTIEVSPSFTPSIVIAAAPGSNVCSGTPVTFTSVTAFGGSTPTYRWVKNGLNVAFGSSYTYLPVNGDTVYCAYRSNLTCRTVDEVPSNGFRMNVIPTLTPSLSFTAEPGLNIEPGQSDTITAVVTGGGTPSYQWYINRVAVPGATTNVLISNTFANNDTVTCTVNSSTGCGTASGYVIMSVKALGVAGMGSNLADVRILPNPNAGMFVVKGAVSNDATNLIVEVTNLLGQTVYSGVVAVNNGTLNTQVQLNKELPNGMYLVRLSAGASTKVIPIVVEK